jgi:apolipoprotein N-acyltransferase
MTTITCALLSALCFYFSLGLGDQWWLAWFAPIPILWLAFGENKGWQIFFASWAAMALGGSSILRAYAGLLPIPVLILAVGAPSLLFAVSVIGARQVQRSLGSIAAMFAFATMWAAFDFLASFSRAGGSVGTPAAAEAGVPLLIQSASIVGFLGITFLLGIVPAGIAVALRRRDPRPAVIAIAVFAANAAFGYWRISAPPPEHLHVAIVESDDMVGSLRTDDRARTFKVVDAYVATIETLRDAHVQLIVLPENISRVAPEWRAEVQEKLQVAANQTQAAVVAGFNTELEGAQRNVAWAFMPGLAQPISYVKRRLVPVLESAIFSPGIAPSVLLSGVGLEICKDMDFQELLRSDQLKTRPTLLAVPAWDFGKDGWSHARVALLRSVENGVPMVRSARDGLLTLNDRYGHLVARAQTVGDFTVLIGDLPLDGRGGNTIYDHIGDVFGWLCLLSGSGLAVSAFARTRRSTDPIAVISR